MGKQTALGICTGGTYIAIAIFFEGWIEDFRSISCVAVIERKGKLGKGCSAQQGRVYNEHL